MAEPEMVQIADLIARTLQGRDDDSVVAAVRADVNALCARFPVYGG
jgi:glycine/serine hydroxymethyltransferase